MAGVTPAGFEGRSFDEVFEGLKENLRAAIGVTISLQEQFAESAISRVVAEEIAAVWDAMQGVYLAFDEAAASGAALDNLAALTGTERFQASPSVAVLTATGDVGTVLPAGRVASSPVTGMRFATQEAVTLAAVAAWAASTPYATGDRVSTANTTARVYVCTSAGASAPSGSGPAGTSSVITDGTAVWAYLGDGVAAGDVGAECTTLGPVQALAGTLTQKDTPVAGWLSVTNLLDAVLGRNRETDAELRVRRRRELSGLGGASVAAIREALLDQNNVPGSVAVTVFENDTDSTNVDGMPPHSVEALVEGGDDQAIWNTLWVAKAAGIQTHGTEVGTVTDSEGGTHTVRFSRPQVLPIWVGGTVQLTPDAPQDDAQALAQIQAAVIAYGDNLPTGLDVVLAKVSGAITALPWVFDVVDMRIGLTAGSLAPANIPVTTRQRADFDASRMTSAQITLQRLTAGQL